VLAQRKGHIVEHRQINTAQRGDILSGHLHAAGIGTQLAANEAQQGGLAGATGAHDGGQQTARNIHVDTVKDNLLAARKTQATNTHPGFRH